MKTKYEQYQELEKDYFSVAQELAGVNEQLASRTLPATERTRLEFIRLDLLNEIDDIGADLETLEIEMGAQLREEEKYT